MNQSTVLMEELASHGYVAASIGRSFETKNMSAEMLEESADREKDRCGAYARGDFLFHLPIPGKATRIFGKK